MFFLLPDFLECCLKPSALERVLAVRAARKDQIRSEAHIKQTQAPCATTELSFQPFTCRSHRSGSSAWRRALAASSPQRGPEPCLNPLPKSLSHVPQKSWRGAPEWAAKPEPGCRPPSLCTRCSRSPPSGSP